MSAEQNLQYEKQLWQKDHDYAKLKDQLLDLQYQIIQRDKVILQFHMDGLNAKGRELGVLPPEEGKQESNPAPRKPTGDDLPNDLGE